MSISSDEVNFLVYRYLQESGFQHSAFVFAYESLVAKSPAARTEGVPPGALVSFLQKGLQYCDIEEHLNEDGSERHCQEAFSLLAPHVCQLASTKPAPGSKADAEMSDGEEDRRVPEAALQTLRGHTAEVYALAWHPADALLATGSGDATARLWDFGDDGTGAGAATAAAAAAAAAAATAAAGGDAAAQPQLGPVRSTVLKHYANNSERSKDIVSLHWSADGARLASASYDGHARIWSRQGELLHTLQRHRGALFALQFNARADTLLTCSFDRTMVAWDATSGEVRQVFEHHQGSVLDVDWRSDGDTFASCSNDKSVSVGRLGEARPLRVCAGHEDDVNCVRWSADGAALASCSDDGTVRLWGGGAAASGPCEVLRGHEQSVLSVRWGPGAAPQALASASHDGTVKLWDAATGAATQSLAGDCAVYSIAFCPAPGSSLLAAGALRGAVNVWDVRSGTLAKTLAGGGDVFEVDWSAQGTLLAAAFSNSSVAVVDMRS